MFTDKFFRVTAGIIMILLIVFLSLQIPNLTNALKDMIYLVLLPILLAGFFYYMLRPVVKFLHQQIDNKELSILITFVGVLALIAFITYFGGSIIYIEIRRLINFLSDYEVSGRVINQAFEQIEELGFLGEFDLEGRITSLVQDMVNRISDYDYFGVFASLTQFAVVILLIPFLVLYFLKDDQKLARSIIKIAPPQKRPLVKKILQVIDSVFGIYIPSQLMVGLVSGAIMFVGYIIIGMPNAIGLSIILAVASVIPFIGPAIGVLPAVFIALTTSLDLVIKVTLLMLIVQQFEGNVVRPILQGGRLDIHPVIIIFVILIATLLFGILGALFAVPVYASVRGIIGILNQAEESI
ncbi:AI-2E family transporter [Natroniella sulfidigena]|uniref:AI-2E family transporter n=1 Tax=Natroniella sulfidigena TaxID=723921 RepID=UPI00200B742C|nr:AI-2E family transporter [Natroniella sulfidigena]MCK8817865.1 AI-2E family transporter [Natroniella sulfidigena]